MELTFHSQDEFEHFTRVYMAGVTALKGLPATISVGYVGELRVAASPSEPLPEIDPVPQPDAETPNGDGIVHEHIDLPPADEESPEPTETQAEPGAEKSKRKRRTKAEIAADNAADVARIAKDEMPVAEFMQTFVPPMVEPVAEALNAGFPSSEVIVTNSERTVIDKPKHQASIESLEKHAAVQAEYTPELIETLKGQAELFDANRTDHLKEGREAIAKHGYIKYMATFKGLGLDSGIAAYNDDQVKLHRAAIAHLMAS